MLCYLFYFNDLKLQKQDEDFALSIGKQSTTQGIIALTDKIKELLGKKIGPNDDYLMDKVFYEKFTTRYGDNSAVYFVCEGAVCGQ